jgi:hypothetical protein
MKHPERVALFALLAAMAVAPLAPGHGTLKGSRAGTDEAQLQSLASQSPAWQTSRAQTDIAPPRAMPDARALRSQSSGDMSRDASSDTVAPGTSPTSRAARALAHPRRFDDPQR